MTFKKYCQYENSRSQKYVTLVSVMITGTPDVSNCRNSSSLMSTSGCSSVAALAVTLTLGIPVLLKAA
jgi:hypothetical protein